MRRDNIAHIEATPGICGGKPRIAGHRIRVQDIVFWHESMGMSPDEIVSEYPGLTLADVYAALAYYHDHRDEIDRDVKADDATVARMRFSKPSKLLEKLDRHEGESDSVSP